MWRKIKPFVISIAAALAVEVLAAWFTRNSINVYLNINLPPLAPPVLMFPIVWSVLFILMGIGSALIYTRRDKTDVSGALKIYGFQIAVNFFWSIIFFNMQAYLFAFIWLLLLWALIIIMIIQFRRISPAAAWMQIPYLLWVSFAGYLNFAVYILNI